MVIIDWIFLDDVLITENLIMPTIFDVMKDDLHTIVQNMTRRLQVSDHGRRLKCVAHHPTLNYQNNNIGRQLNVICKYIGASTKIHKSKQWQFCYYYFLVPPQPNTEILQQFGYKIGEAGEIRVDINANPRPRIEWTVGPQKIKEGYSDDSGRYKAEPLVDEVKECSKNVK